MINGINHITLAVSDLEVSFNVYTKILRLKPIAKWGKGAYLTAGDNWMLVLLHAAQFNKPLQLF
jgi:catechol 2,3-dioxygenase-like lactoylglutathione lyase family enzyme